MAVAGQWRMGDVLAGGGGDEEEEMCVCVRISSAYTFTCPGRFAGQEISYTFHSDNQFTFTLI